ncbi:hypothetical protein HUO13_02405 [Saccharopolyspora erythraea]|uniref:hypothetical protein n=1 Tax=Saccharopolyspora erythraea TaxID=1836 RepID=UPI001BAD75BB|nr:hypothetical protein [Saccharopolyspora erythraea]QUG99803.1 hypothetical protein HUO13_02405 [Saccharopolyspora erythraea]
MVIAQRARVAADLALEQCRQHRGAVTKPCRSCRGFGVRLARQSDRDLLVISGQILDEVARYIGAVEAMSVPRSRRVWDAQEEAVGSARALDRAARSVRELILRSRERPND